MLCSLKNIAYLCSAKTYMMTNCIGIPTFDSIVNRIWLHSLPNPFVVCCKRCKSWRTKGMAMQPNFLYQR